MKKHLLLTIVGNTILLIATISGANAATLQPSVTILDSITPTANPTDPTANPTFNPSGIQSILSSNGSLSTVFGGIVTAFPELVAQLADTEAKMNSLVDSYDYDSVWNQFVSFVKDPDKWIRDKLVGAILDGWSVVVGELADEGFILSILALPIPLAFSFINTKPLEIWFASLWGLGIFKFSMTILGACLGFINANTSGSQPAYSLELGFAIGAPIREHPTFLNGSKVLAVNSYIL